MTTLYAASAATTAAYDTRYLAEAPGEVPGFKRPETHRGDSHGCGARDLGAMRAIADVLGHSPEILMNVYAEVFPDHRAAVVERIGRRANSSA